MDQKIKEWYYAHDADITYGEAKTNIWPTLVVIVLIIIMVFVRINNLGNSANIFGTISWTDKGLTYTKYSNDEPQSSQVQLTEEELLDITFTAAPFTWSLSEDGTINDMLAASYQYIIYDGYGTFQWTEGPGISYQVDKPGVYTLHWESSEGLECDQTVTIIE